MSNLRQAAELALEIIETHHGEFDYANEITALRAALAEPEQEPVAWAVSPRYEDSDGYFDFTDSKDTAEILQKRGWVITPLYTTPPQRPWVGLTDEKIAEVAERMEASDPTDSFWREFARAIEAAHNIGVNT